MRPRATHRDSAMPRLRGLDSLVAAGIPGAQVNDNGEATAVGIADVRTSRPMAADLSFRAGSITKSFVSTIGLQLIAEGALRLDDDTVERWLPGLLAYGDQVTVRMLLQHTSGIPDYWEYGPNPLVYAFVNNAAARRQTFTPQQLVARIADAPQAFSPGARATYSNTNSVILGLIVERVTGNTMRSELRRRLIRPLRLGRTSFPVTEARMPARSTRGYTSPLSGRQPVAGPLSDVTEYIPSALWAMGNILSTSGDLSRFYGALLGGQLLPPRLLREMLRTRPVDTPGWPGIGFGLGIWSWDMPRGGRVYGHEGTVPGSNTFAYSNADGTRVVVMQHNLMFSTVDTYVDVVSPAYVSLWSDGGEAA